MDSETGEREQREEERTEKETEERERGEVETSGHITIHEGCK